MIKMNKTARILSVLALVLCLMIALGVTAFATNDGVETVAETTNVAKIGDTEYATLKAAMTEANKAAGNYTITLLKDSAEVFTFAQNGGKITINGNGKTFTGKITLNAGSGELVITNATLTPSNADAKTIVLNASTAPDITIDGCIMKNVGTKGAIVWGQASRTDNKVVIKNSTASNLQYLVGTNQSGCEDITIENVTATNMAYLIRPLKAKNVTVKNVTYSGLTFIQVKVTSKSCKLHLENVNVTTNGYAAVMGGSEGSGLIPYVIETKGENTFVRDGAEVATPAWIGLDATLYTLKNLNSYPESITASNADVIRGDNEVTVKYTGIVNFVPNANGIWSNWISFIITKPEGVDATKAMVKIPSGSTYKEVTLASVLDSGKDFATMWTSIQYRNAFQYEIDWDGNGTYDLVVKIDGTEATAERALAGKGTMADPYKIGSLADLILFRDSVNAGETKYNAPGVYVVLTANIDLSSVENWAPIGNWDYSFDANFNGKGYKIMNLKMANTDGYLGFFGITANNTIENLVIENVTINSTGEIVASAIAYPYYTTVSNITVCGNIAIKGGNYTAGVLAYTRLCQNASNLTVSGNDGSYITGAITVGGVIADIQMNGGLKANYSNFTIENVEVTGTSKATGAIAGILGAQKVTNITVANAGNVAAFGTLGSAATIENANVDCALIGAGYGTGTAIEASIGNTYFSTFADAYAAANEGDTIIVYTTVKVTSDLIIDKNVTVKAAASCQCDIFDVRNGATLTITAGTFDSTASPEGYTIYIGNNSATRTGNVVITGGTFVSRCTVVYVGCGSLTINGGDFSIVELDNNGYAYVINCKDANYDTGVATVSITGGTFTNWNPANNAAEGTNTNFAAGAVVKNGNKYTVYTTFAAAYAAANEGDTIILASDLTISDTIAVIINKAITLDGNGKTLYATATGSTARAINVSGANGVTIKNLTIVASGERAINIIQNATNVTIENVTATAANYTVNVASSAPNAVVTIKGSTLNGLCTVNVSAKNAKVTVDNSTINCNDNNTTAGESYAAIALNKEAVGASIVVTNSTVNVADGSDSAKGRNGAENGTVTINGSTDDVIVIVAVITYEGSNYFHGFASLKAAFEFAKDGDTITLIRDITTSEAITNTKKITLDLNGKTITGTDNATGSFGLITNKGELTITGNGKMTLLATNNRGWNAYSSVISNTVGGKLVVENGTIEHLGGTDMAYAIDNLTNGANTTATVIINGGEIKSTYFAIRQFANGGTNNLTINGGLVEYAWMQSPNANANKANITVTGGEVYGICLSGNNAIVTLATAPNTVGEVYGTMPAGMVLTGSAATGFGLANAKVSVNGTAYATLADAIAAAKAGDTITFLADINENVTINKNITIDGANYTYTGQMTLTSTSTVKNVNFDGKGYNGYAVVTKKASVVTIENCTVTGYGYGFLNINSSNDKTYVRNVTISDVSYGIKVDYSNGVTLENVTMTNVRYGILDSNYGNKTYTIKNSTITTIDIWERSAAKTTTFNFVGINTVKTLSTSAYAKYAGFKNGNTYGDLASMADKFSTITMIGNTRGAGAVIDKNITIDFGGFTYTLTSGVGSTGTESNGLQLLAGNTVILKKGTLEVDAASADKFYILVQNYANLEVFNMTLDGTNLDKWSKTDGDSYTLSNNSGTVKLTGTTKIIANDDGELAFAFDVCDKSAWGYALPTVTVASTVTIEGKIEAVAKVGKVYYATLQQAIDEATAGATVTLVRDSEGAGAVINKNLTLNFNGFTYTLTSGVGSTGTESNGLQILKGNKVILMKGTLKVADSAADKFYILVQNYSDLEVYNMTLDGTNLDKWSKTDGDSYTLSNNSGEVKITGTTKIIANNDGALAFAFDVCDKSAWGYELPTVTVASTAKIEGAIEAPVRVGRVYYATFEAGYAVAVEDNEILYLASDLYLTEKDVVKTADGLNVMFLFDKNVTFNFNGNTIYVDYDSNELLYAVMYVEDGVTVSFVDGNDDKGGIELKTGDTLAGKYDCVAYMFWKRGTTGNMYIMGGTYHANKLEDSMVYTNGNGKVTVKRGTFILDNVGSGTNGSPWIFNAQGQNEKKIVVMGGSFNADVFHQHWFFEVSASQDLALAYDAETGLYTVVDAVAYVNEQHFSSRWYTKNVGYATLEEAIAAVEDVRTVKIGKNAYTSAPEVVTLLTDIKGAGLVIDKDITIDFNGKEYVFAGAAVGSSNTKTNGFQILKDNDVTLKNGKLSVEEEAAKKYAMLIQNYANLTLENMYLDGTNLDYSNKTSYTLSINCGNVVIKGKTTIKANKREGVAADYAWDVYDYTSAGYTLPTLTVEGELHTEGKTLYGEKTLVNGYTVYTATK